MSKVSTYSVPVIYVRFSLAYSVSHVPAHPKWPSQLLGDIWSLVAKGDDRAWIYMRLKNRHDLPEDYKLYSPSYICPWWNSHSLSISLPFYLTPFYFTPFLSHSLSISLPFYLTFFLSHYLSIYLKNPLDLPNNIRTQNSPSYICQRWYRRWYIRCQ
jgi:hypothetical protein